MRLNGAVQVLLACSQSANLKSVTHPHLSVEVDSTDRPQPDGIGWKNGAGSPFGSWSFSLLYQGEPTCKAIVYAAMGLPTDSLDEKNLKDNGGSPRAVELFDIETSPDSRRKGHATALLDFIFEWLPSECEDHATLIFAKDASDIHGLYEHWGWVREEEDGYEHVVSRALRPLDTASTLG